MGLVLSNVADGSGLPTTASPRDLGIEILPKMEKQMGKKTENETETLVIWGYIGIHVYNNYLHWTLYRPSTLPTLGYLDS